MIVVVEQLFRSVRPTGISAVGGVNVTVFGSGFDSKDLHLYSCSLKMGNVSVEATVTSISANADVICFVYPWPGSGGLAERCLVVNSGESFVNTSLVGSRRRRRGRYVFRVVQLFHDTDNGVRGSVCS